MKEKARVVHEFDVAEHFIDVVVVVPKERNENNGRDYHSKQCSFFMVFGYAGKAFLMPWETSSLWSKESICRHSLYSLYDSVSLPFLSSRAACCRIPFSNSAMGLLEAMTIISLPAITSE